MTRRRFTPEEDAVIVAHYGRLTLRQIGVQIDRHWTAVQQRVNRLLRDGVLPERRSVKAPPWTAAERDRLAELWGTLPDRIVARRLGRSVDACKVYATRHLHLARSDQFLTARAVARIFGVDEHLVLRWRDQGWLAGRRSSVGCAGGRSAMWRFEPEAVERFIRRYPYAYDRRRIERGTYERNLADAVHARDPWLTVPEAAAALGVGAETVREHLRRGWLPGVRAPRKGNNGVWMVRGRDLGRFSLRRPPVPGSTGNPLHGAGAWHRRRRNAGTGSEGMEAAG